MSAKATAPGPEATLPERLRYARGLRDVGTKPLSTRAGLSPATVHFIENQSGDPKVSTVLALARELDVRPEWLAFGTGPVEPFPPELRGEG